MTEQKTLHSILDSLPAIVVLYARDRSLRFVNRHFRDLFGDPGNRSCHEILHRQEDPCGECHPFQVFSTQCPVEWELTLADGRTYQMHASPFTDSDGSPLVLELGIDITDRKRGEGMLKSLKDCLLGFGADPIENINRLTALIGEFLGATCAFYNRLEGDLLYSWGRWNAPPDFNPVDRADGHICNDVIRKASGDVLVLRNLQEGPYARTDPNVVPYGLQSYIGHAVEFGGKRVGSLCAVFQRDHLPGESDKEMMRAIAKAIGVEEQRRWAAETLRESEERYRALFSRANVGICIMSPDGKLMEVNESFARMHGYSTGELLRMNIKDLDAPDTSKKFSDRMSRLLAGETLTVEVEHYHKDGHIFPLEASASLVSFGGESYIQSFHRDITERKQAEQEKEKLQDQLQQAMKMEGMGRLAGGVAHDFNNQLTVISGYVTMAQMSLSPSDPAAGFLAEVKQAAERSAALTQQLLAFSRKQFIKPKITDLNELVAGMHTMLVRLIGENIELKTSTGADLGRVKIDPGQIEQVLLNLAVNSRDSMPEGGKLLIETANIDLDEEYCTRHPYVRPGRFVMLAVGDTGHGMSEEVKRRIFEPFFTTKPKGAGTVLGLATIYGVVKQSEGSIEVYSEVGKGTTFKIYFPRVEGEDAIPGVSDLTMEFLKGSETVFVVEDEEALRNMCVRLLEGLGYRVMQASSGDEAIAMAKEHVKRIDLLMTDVMMPGMNGRELAIRLSHIHPEARVLFTSGYTDDAIVRHGVLEEEVSFIAKPYSPSELARKIREALDKA